jgi:hypothetical protein
MALIQLRRDTAADWTSNNPTLAAGELGVETDTGDWKTGDGVTAWTSLSYTTGVNGDWSTAQAINAQTGTSYTLVLGDAGKCVQITNGGNITLTVPPNSSVAFSVGVHIDITQWGAGQITVAQGSGVTIRSSPTRKLRGQYAAAHLFKVATDEWLLTGDLAAI